MKTSTKQARNFRPTISKIVMAFAVASVMGGMALTPALADNDRRDNHRQVHRDNGRHNGEWRGDRHYRRVYQDPYYYSQPYYAQPVYAPPPVYYAPQPSAGVSIFLPLNIRR